MRKNKKFKFEINQYDIASNRNKEALLISDIHSQYHQEIVDFINLSDCDFVLIPGDVIDSNHNYRNGIKFLNSLSKQTFVSLGNHEKNLKFDISTLIDNPYIKILDNSSCSYDDFEICGLTHNKNENESIMINNFLNKVGYKILLCHQPELRDSLKLENFDLIVSGHAHGGQWRVHNRGIYAPNQGFLPKYTKGKYGNLIVSSGIANMHLVPRINNIPEIVIVNFQKNN